MKPADGGPYGERREHAVPAFVAADELDALRPDGPTGYLLAVLIADGAVAKFHGHRGARLERRSPERRRDLTT